MNNFQAGPEGIEWGNQLNATLHQTFANGSEIKTPCFLDVTKSPMLASDLTPINDAAFAGKETDRYITINSDKSQQQYRSYEVIGTTMQVEE